MPPAAQPLGEVVGRRPIDAAAPRRRRDVVQPVQPNPQMLPAVMRGEDHRGFRRQRGHGDAADDRHRRGVERPQRRQRKQRLFRRQTVVQFDHRRRPRPDQRQSVAAAQGPVGGQTGVLRPIAQRRQRFQRLAPGGGRRQQVKVKGVAAGDVAMQQDPRRRPFQGDDRDAGRGQRPDRRRQFGGQSQQPADAPPPQRGQAGEGGFG